MILSYKSFKIDDTQNNLHKVGFFIIRMTINENEGVGVDHTMMTLLHNIIQEHSERQVSLITDSHSLIVEFRS